MALYWKGFCIACKGIPTTIWVSIVALLVGALLGLLLALGSQGRNKVLKAICRVYIDVVRGTPMIVQALVFAYGIPQLLQANGIMFRWPYLVIPAVMCCGLNSAAYMSEVVRSGIQAVDKGQMEAARSLGMSKRMAMRLIIIPQAVKIILPAFCNEFVTLIKETAVLSYVGVIEILRRGALWNAQSFETFPAYIGVALAYMLLTIPLTKVIGRYEKKLKAQEA